ncbi:hypothetical protein Q1695_002866 [Nippostrongylus brasiliensis]|nr:hypothetical protein Q1695_002866 [Nippostrongylus brasiliensis]
MESADGPTQGHPPVNGALESRNLRRKSNGSPRFAIICRCEDDGKKARRSGSAEWETSLPVERSRRDSFARMIPLSTTPS